MLYIEERARWEKQEKQEKLKVNHKHSKNFF